MASKVATLVKDELAEPAPLKISLKSSIKPPVLTTNHDHPHSPSNTANGGRSSFENMKLNQYEYDISLLYNFLSENGEEILLDPLLLKEFETISLEAMDRGQEVSALKEILIQHGWIGTQYSLSALDIESLTQTLGNLYITRVIQSKIIAEEQADFDANPEVFLQEDSLVKSFTPNSLLHILSADIHFELFSELKVKCVKVYGACVLADISGFTKMSARHCQDGSRGLDKLHQATNGFLGALVRTVYSYGGDGNLIYTFLIDDSLIKSVVISFAGDALICTFVNEDQYYDESEDHTERPPDRAVMKECCLRAMQCALELKDHHTKDLTAHIAVSNGKMSFATLGGLDSEWVCLLNGPCISDLSSNEYLTNSFLYWFIGCIDDAGSREVVATSSCYHAIQDNLKNAEYIEVETLPSGNLKILTIKTPSQFKQKNNRILQFDSTDELIDFARYFVPRPAQYAISSGSFDHINELREVTTMFFKLDSYNPRAHEDPVSLQPFFYMAQEALTHTGGFMRQFLIDDKGCVLIGMWGVPSFSHANNASRALYCAISIMNGLVELKHKGSIGITTGSIYCGNVGSVLRRDYVGIGDKVNLAARLMGKAKGNVFVDENSYHQLSTDAKAKLVKSTDGLILKGIAEPVYPYIIKDFSADTFKLDEHVDNNSMNLDPSVTKILEDQLDKISVNVHSAMEEKMLRETRGKALKLVGTKIANEVTLTILRGMPGMGKKTSALYFMRSAKNRYLRF